MRCGRRAELHAENPKKRIKVMGEDLVVYRGDDGTLRLRGRDTARIAAVRSTTASSKAARSAVPIMAGSSQRDGRVLEQPFEPEGSTYKDRVRQRAYPVEELGGLLFVYMGPLPAPLLPRWDVLVRKDGKRRMRSSGRR